MKTTNEALAPCEKESNRLLFVESEKYSKREIEKAKAMCVNDCFRFNECSKLLYHMDYSNGVENATYMIDRLYGVVAGVYLNTPLIELLLENSIASNNERESATTVVVEKAKTSYGSKSGKYTRKKLGKRKCLVCGKMFQLKRNTTRNCSVTCGNKFRLEKAFYLEQHAKALHNETIEMEQQE